MQRAQAAGVPVRVRRRDHPPFALGPNVLYTHTYQNLAIDGAGFATVTSYVCTPGAGSYALLNKNLCGGYNIGGNATDDSLSVLDASGTLQGGPLLVDDTLLVAGQPYGMRLQDMAGLDSRVPAGAVGPGSTILVRDATYAPNLNMMQWTYRVVPVPGAVWLFGSAVGLMGLIRRRISA